MTTSRHPGSLTANQLKYIAAAGMVLDSLFFAFPGRFPPVFRLLSRYVAPLFAFFVTEGWIHTRNRGRYLTRLWTAAVLMEGGNLISFFLLGPGHQITENIFLTFAIACTILRLWEREDGGSFALGLLLLAAAFWLGERPGSMGGFPIWIEGGCQMTALILIFYGYRGDRARQAAAWLLFDLIYITVFHAWRMPSGYPSVSVWWATLCRYSDPYTFLFLPFLLVYNGRKGSMDRIHRNFFYFFYPAHLWVLHLLAMVEAG